MGQNSNQCLPASSSYKISFLCHDSAVSTDLHQPCCKCHVLLTLITLMLAAKSHRQLPSWGTPLLRFFYWFHPLQWNDNLWEERVHCVPCPRQTIIYYFRSISWVLLRWHFSSPRLIVSDCRLQSLLHAGGSWYSFGAVAQTSFTGIFQAVFICCLLLAAWFNFSQDLK